MTVIRGSSPSVAPKTAPVRAPVSPASTPTSAAPAAAPDEAFEATKKRPLSITGRRAAVTVPLEETMSVSELLLSAQRAGRRGATPPAPPTPPVLDDEGRAAKALEGFPSVPSTHPAMQHAETVRAELRRDGLPTDATGVDVYIVGDHPDHGGMVARTIAGQTGLAPGATLHLSEPIENPKLAGLDPHERSEVSMRALSVKVGSASVDEFKEATVEALEAAYLSPKAELDYLVDHTPADGKTRLVNMSWGTSEENMVSSALKGAIDNPDSPLIAAANAGRSKQGLPPLDLSRREDQAVVRTFLRAQVKAALADPANRERLSTARKEATAAVARAREAGFLPIAAAGNFFEPGVHDDSSRGTANVVATIPGVLSVGSTSFGDPTRLGDESMGTSSSTGAAISAPGVDLPIARNADGTTRDVSGTSFAAPYAASVAALMIKANPNITPAQLEHILQSDAVAHNVKGTLRDGAGVIDAAAAVREARALQSYAGPSKAHVTTDLPLSTQRALHDTLRGLMPTTSTAYKEALKLGTNDAFAELSAGAQQAMLHAVAADRADTSLAGRLIELAECKPFHELGPAAQARVAANFANQFETKEILTKLTDPALASLDVRVKDAYVAAFSKAPSKAADLDEALASSAFTALKPEVQQAFFQAVEQNTDTFREEDPARAKLFEFVKSRDFERLSPAGQERWLRGLGAESKDTREAAFESLTTVSKWPTTGRERERTFHAAGSVLQHPREMSPLGREPLPGASTNEPRITSRDTTSAGVFISLALESVDPKPRPATVHTVTVDGQAIKVLMPRPVPTGDFPTIESIAKGLAALPATVRRDVQEVVVDPEYKNGVMAGVAKDKKPNRIYLGFGAPSSTADMAGMMSHEATHLKVSRLVDAERKAKVPQDASFMGRWEKAIDGDDFWPSKYAARSFQEDVAETAQRYFQVKGTPEEATMKRELPRRFAMIEALLAEP